MSFNEQGSDAISSGQSDDTSAVPHEAPAFVATNPSFGALTQAAESRSSSSDSESHNADVHDLSSTAAPAASAGIPLDAHEAPPRLPLPPRLDVAPSTRRDAGAEYNSEHNSEGGDSPIPGSPRRRSSIVVAFAKGVGNRLGLRQKGAALKDDGSAEEGGSPTADAAHAPPGEVSLPGAPADDSPRRRRPSVTARQAAAPEGPAAAAAVPSTAPSSQSSTDPLHIEGASFVSDAQGGDFNTSPTFHSRRPPAPHSAPRQGSLQDRKSLP